MQSSTLLTGRRLKSDGSLFLTRMLGIVVEGTCMSVIVIMEGGERAVVLEMVLHVVVMMKT